MDALYKYFLFFCLISEGFNFIFYPIKSFDEPDRFENLLSFNSIYTTIEMGTPPQKVDFYFNMDDSKMHVTNIGCKNNNLFDSEYSSSLYILGEPNMEEPSKSTIVAIDTLFFNSNMSLTEKIEMDEFYLYYSVDFEKDQEYLCGKIGLSLMPYETFEDLSDEMEYYLKYTRSQNKYFSFLNYKGEDFFINGIFLNQEFTDIFKEDQTISWINPIMKDNYFHWEITMNDIFYNKIHFKGNIIFELNPLFELIIGNNDYLKNIQKDFFDSYIKKKICQIKTINEYKIFECDSNQFNIKDIQKFPNLYMYNSGINHAFDMNGEELFIELNDKIYFKIIFNVKNENNKWVLGRIFFRKYPTTFSPYNKIIGFYINPNEGKIPGRMVEEDDNSKNNKHGALFYILIVFASLVFTCFGLFIGRKLVLPRRKKVNELIDDFYQYDSNDKKENLKNDENNGEKELSPKEMESKV